MNAASKALTGPRGSQWEYPRGQKDWLIESLGITLGPWGSLPILHRRHPGVAGKVKGGCPEKPEWGKSHKATREHCSHPWGHDIAIPTLQQCMPFETTLVLLIPWAQAFSHTDAISQQLSSVCQDMAYLKP